MSWSRFWIVLSLLGAVEFALQLYNLPPQPLVSVVISAVGFVGLIVGVIWVFTVGVPMSRAMLKRVPKEERSHADKFPRTGALAFVVLFIALAQYRACSP